MQDFTFRASAVSAEAESGFVAGVYRWMAAGLFVTALSAFLTLATPSLLIAIATKPLVMMALVLAQFGLVIWLSSRVMTMSQGAAVGAFTGYSALTGVVLAPIFVVYTGASIAATFAITAGTFIIFSVYGYVTKKDLTSVGSIAGMGLLGLILASVVNWFLKSPAMDWVITYALVAVFLVLIAYDTQKLKALCQWGYASEGDARQRLAILGALTLYLDFINLFLLLLRIFGRRND